MRKNARGREGEKGECLAAIELRLRIEINRDSRRFTFMIHDL